MESDRQGNPMTMRSRSQQAGITVIGFLILATLFGVVGLAAIKVVPMYLQNMRLSTVLDDVDKELSGTSTTPEAIQRELQRRFDVDYVQLPPENIRISQGRNGYQVRIQYENRAPYVADIWLMVAFDKQVEIER